MKDCLNCEYDGKECYECWYLGESENAIAARREDLDRACSRVFGDSQ